MNEESQEPTADTSRDAEVPEVIERRSVDAFFQGAQAVGVLTGGLGTFAIGVSKLKETFGGGNQSCEPPPSASDAAAGADEPK